MKKSGKLLISVQFSAVFNNKKSVHGKFFSVHAARNALNQPRLGLTISKRVSKHAVQRNRIKRQIRESFRLNSELLSPIDYVVLTKIGCVDQENKILRVELDKLWNKASQKCELC